MEQANAPDAAVQINFSLQIGKGSLNASAEVPNRPVPLTELLPVLQQLSSNIVSAIGEAVHEEGYQISCKAGCAACCRQLIPVSLFEADYFAAWIRGLPQEQQAYLEARFSAALGALQSKGMLQRLDFVNAPAHGSDEELEFLSDYIKADVACPFLQNESCSIYPIRPLICREYMVTSPPQFCAAPTKSTVRTVPMPVRLSRAMISLGEQVSAEKRGWIPLVFLFAWIRNGATVGRAYEMPGPDLLRVVVEELVAPATEADSPT